MPRHRALFLHGGPGSSALMEREWFGDRLPIHWWDQPRPAERSAQTFHNLVDAAAAQLDTQFSEASRSIPLVASSFGGNIALALARDVPRQIASITLLCCPPDVRVGLIRFGQKLAARNQILGLNAALSNAHEACAPSAFWALADAIFSVPGVFDAYWSPGATKQSALFTDLVANHSLIDPAVFRAVMDDFLGLRPASRPAKFAGPMSVVIGRHDPFGDVDAESGAWVRDYPQAVVNIVDAGHFPHMELPEAEWFPFADLLLR